MNLTFARLKRHQLGTALFNSFNRWWEGLGCTPCRAEAPRQLSQLHPAAPQQQGRVNHSLPICGFALFPNNQKVRLQSKQSNSIFWLFYIAAGCKPAHSASAKNTKVFCFLLVLSCARVVCHDLEVLQLKSESLLR